MNRMIRDIATHNVHPEDRAIFSISNTALNNATKYAIAKTKKQPAYGFTAKFGRDRWSNIAKHISKQIHDIEIHSFDNETLEFFIVTRKSGMHPTRMEWRQQANGRKASAPEAATSYTVLCPVKCGTQTDIRTKPVRQQTGWPIMVCHGCGKEYSTRTATCSRCRIVTHKCKCPAINTKAHSQQQQSKNWLQHIIDNTKPKGDTKHSQPTLQQTRCPGCDSLCNPKPGAEWAWCKSCKKQFRIRRRSKPRQAEDIHHREDKRARIKFF